MARPLVPRRQIAFKWPLDLHARISDEIQTRGVSFAAFVYRACELYLDTLKNERQLTSSNALGLPRGTARLNIARSTATSDLDVPSAVFERFRQR